MKRTILTAFLIAVFLATATAQYFPIDTARLNKAYKTLEQGIRTVETEMEFLEAFPTTWLEFYMTYCYRYNEFNNMSQMCSTHATELFNLTHINDTVLCKKIVNVTIGMKEIGESTCWYQNFLVGYILNNEHLVLNYLSTLYKGYQMEFWQFCWSTVTECNREEDFEEFYNRNKEKYPKEMEISRVAFEHFYNGINYPILLPHEYDKYQHRQGYRNYKVKFDDYIEK